MSPAPIRHPWETPPEPSAPIEVAEGVFWLRLPLPMTLDHVNVYLLRDEGGGWTLVDTGLNWRKGRAALDAGLEALGARVTRILVTHHHPDHSGLAGIYRAQGAELLMPRVAWLTARMLVLDEQDRPTDEAIAFWRSAGMDPEILAGRMNERPFNFADSVAPLPLGFTDLVEGTRLRAGGRDWTVRLGQGHAPDHATLWCEDDPIVLGGDQLLPGISPNISLYPTEPEADPLRGWLESCARLSPFATEEQLVLGGHKLPYTGLPRRLRQLEDNHHSALRRLTAHLETPRTAAECFAPLFKREISTGNYGLALGESMAHLIHLWHRGDAQRERRADGAWLWTSR